MSARVFNPVVMTELTRLRHQTKDKQNLNHPHQHSTLPAARVRRDLFGPVNHEETRKFVEAELLNQQKIDSDRWGFDFLRDIPKTNHHKYSWERVSTDKVPEIYMPAIPAPSSTRVPIHRPIPQTPKKDYATSVLSQFGSTPEGSGGGGIMTVSDLLNSAFDDFDCAMMLVEPQVTVPVTIKPVDQDGDTERCLRNGIVAVGDGCCRAFVNMNTTPTSTRKAQSRITGKVLSSISIRMCFLL